MAASAHTLNSYRLIDGHGMPNVVRIQFSLLTEEAQPATLMQTCKPTVSHAIGCSQQFSFWSWHLSHSTTDPSSLTQTVTGPRGSGACMLGFRQPGPATLQYQHPQQSRVQDSSHRVLQEHMPPSQLHVTSNSVAYSISINWRGNCVASTACSKGFVVRASANPSSAPAFCAIIWSVSSSSR